MTDLKSVLLALGRATTRRQADEALHHALEVLVSCSSLTSTQLLVYALDQLVTRTRCCGEKEFLHHLQRVLSVCNKPLHKAEFLVSFLVDRLGSLSDSSRPHVTNAPTMLVEIHKANPTVRLGYSSAFYRLLCSESHPQDANDARFDLVEPLFLAILTNPTEESSSKDVILHLISRAAWTGDRLKTRSIALLRRAICGFPCETSQENSLVFSTMCTIAVDLICSTHSPQAEDVKLLCRLLVNRLLFHLANDLGIAALLELLHRFAQTAPRIVFPTICLPFGFLMVQVGNCVMEQQLMVEILDLCLVSATQQTGSKPAMERTVYVEFVLPALLSVISTVPEASCTIALMEEYVTKQPFVRELVKPEAFGCNELIVLLSLVGEIVADEGSLVEWINQLEKLLEAQEATQETPPAEESVLVSLLCASCLVCPGKRKKRNATISLCKKSARRFPDHSRLVMSTAMYLLTQKPNRPHHAEWVNELLYLVAEIASVSSDCMKMALRLIRELNGCEKSQSMGIRLLFCLWKSEKRVFPHLEQIIKERFARESAEESNDSQLSMELQVCTIATIHEVCAVDGEIGVSFISEIQSCLEKKTLATVCLAIKSIKALCANECLDFYTALKIVQVKMRKKKIFCSSDPLFQQDLCELYALGAAEATEHKKQSVQLLTDLWKYATSGHSSVRSAAVQAMNAFSLFHLNLAATDMELRDLSDEDRETFCQTAEERRNELFELIKCEQAANVRIEQEKLFQRVLMHESEKYVSRGQQGGQQQQISASATKELQKACPTQQDISLEFGDSMHHLTGVLLAYSVPHVSKPNIRKDKLIRSLQSSIEQKETLLKQWALSSVELEVDVIAISAFVNAWSCYSQSLLSLYVRLAEQQSTIGMESELSTQKVATSLAQLFDWLHCEEVWPTGFVAVGALAGQAFDRFGRKVNLDQYMRSAQLLCGELSVCRERMRVFESEKESLERRSAFALLGLIGLFRDQMEAQLVEDIIESTEWFAEHGGELSSIVAALCLGQIGCRIGYGDSQQPASDFTFEVVVKSVLVKFLGCFLDESETTANADAFLKSASSPVFCTSSSRCLGHCQEKALAWSFAFGSLIQALVPAGHASWLENARLLVEALVQNDRINRFYVLEAILYAECLEFQVVTLNQVYSYLDACIQLAVSSSPCGHLLLTIPNLIMTLERYGRSALSPKRDRVMQMMDDVIKTRDGSDVSYALYGLANMLGFCFGVGNAAEIDGVQHFTHGSHASGVIERLRSHSEICPAVIGALIGGCSNMSVLSSDFEQRVSLNQNTLLFRVLEHLKRTVSPTPVESSFLGSCLRCTGGCALPPMQYDALVRRLFRSGLGEDMQKACVEFCGRQRGNHSLLEFLAHLIRPKWNFGILPASIQMELVKSLEALGVALAAEEFIALVEDLFRGISSGRAHRRSDQQDADLLRTLFASLQCVQANAKTSEATKASIQQRTLEVFLPTLPSAIGDGRIVNSVACLEQLVLSFVSLLSNMDQKPVQSFLRNALASSDCSEVSSLVFCSVVIELVGLKCCDTSELRLVLRLLCGLSRTDRLAIRVAHKAISCLCNRVERRAREQSQWILFLLDETTNAMKNDLKNNVEMAVLLLGGAVVLWKSRNSLLGSSLTAWRSTITKYLLPSAMVVARNPRRDDVPVDQLVVLIESTEAKSWHWLATQLLTLLHQHGWLHASGQVKRQDLFAQTLLHF